MENNQKFEDKARKAFEEIVKFIKEIAVAILDFVERIKRVLANHPEAKKHMQIASNTNNSRIKRKNIKKLRLLSKGGRLFN
ncbi:hypothetical protein [Paenilisteria rocourtiae]|uniref:Uncharacterized protein n=1 Tax=Listeria rocourtiae TaxID=647910 RepID=A0A4R6ZP35_9LIST|nr:hypothetical protein [Listeria rocourtiae]EUJ51808.1 hypothetical protein PROCOU_01517 [Listeria rocourtiae FSL F6-920]TDR54198.1 hypothetical protein DFP96_103298 [Listeria rocourtiae]